MSKRRELTVLCCVLALASARVSLAQSLGNAGRMEIRVEDSTGARVPGASVELQNRASGFDQTRRTDPSGWVQFVNLPFNPYRVIVSKPGFTTVRRDTLVQSPIPFTTEFVLEPSAQHEEVRVRISNEDLLERDPSSNTDIDRNLISRLPIEGSSSELSTLIARTTPGVVEDSSGMFHPLGEEQDTSLSIDNQPVTDQQGRTSSAQLPLGAIQSVEIITGVPPAEFGEKNGLIVRATTRSGLGIKKPEGSFGLQYGSFGTATGHLDLSAGSQRLGNFLALSGLNTRRFLDTPEFLPLHDRGNSESVFDRIDYQPRTQDSLHFNVFLARSRFQTPNTFDSQTAGQDQREFLKSFNIATGYNHLFGPSKLLNANLYARSEQIHYLPSANIFSDQPATLQQARRLTNVGAKTEFLYAAGIHNAKVGVEMGRTSLSERFQFGITAPGFNSPCVNSNDDPAPIATLVALEQCAAAGLAPNPDFRLGLLPYDLTRKGSQFNFRGAKNINHGALYGQDLLSWKRLSAMLGLRIERYRGFTSATAVQPRVGLSYLLKPTNTVLRASYGRMLETPANEGLVLANFAGSGLSTPGTLGATAVQPLQSGRRHQFNVGVQQALGRHWAANADYVWKYTSPAFDSDSLYNTPLTFPTAWRKSKIDGVSASINFPENHGVSAFCVLGHVRARFFGPESGGILLNPLNRLSVFRIDQDQAFQQSTHIRYQPKKSGPWVAFNWRYDSGVVASSVPDVASALKLTGDQQASIGLSCAGKWAAVNAPITSCNAGDFSTLRVRIPASGTENDDHNPPRISPYHLFDFSAGIENILRADKFPVSLRFNIFNLTNQAALYNLLSTFNGTHFITPRSLHVELKFDL